MIKTIRDSVIAFCYFSVVCGVFYPLLVTGVGQLTLPHEANGSLIKSGNHVIGSVLVGQNFSSPKYFWPRISATSPSPYNSESSGASNLAASNPAFTKQLIEAITKYGATGVTGKLPIDLVTSSESGLDPDISIDAALIQIPRIAKTRNSTEAKIREVVLNHVHPRPLGILGEPRANVLELNILLDNL